MALREAIALHRAGRSKQAEQHLRDHLRSRPDDHAALHLLGTIAHESGRPEEAVKWMRKSIRSAPSQPQYYVNLAAVLGRMGKHEESLTNLLNARKLAGSIPELHSNLGVTLEALGRIPEAASSYRTAIQLRPSYPEAHFNLANVLGRMGRFHEAAGEYRQALRLRPQYAKAFDGLGGCASELGDIEEAAACHRKVVEHDPTNAAARSTLLYLLHFHPAVDAPTLWREHQEWDRLICQPVRATLRPHENDRSPDRKLRVGYLSPDFREHTVPHFVTAALENHDPRQFELFCYSDVEKSDAITSRLRTMVEHWTDVRGKDDQTVEALIREDRIDILIDLRGHGGGNRLPLFCRKPAPIQVNMVGYFDTTGLSTMDYRVTDAYQDPPGQTEHLHSENLVRIAPSCWCYTPADNPPVLQPPPALKNGYITFGSLNKIIKTSRACVQAWVKVLAAVPGSRLMVSVASDESARIVRQRLIDMGLPGERLILVGKTQTDWQYLERFNEIDIALDTFPFNGITTTCDGLWMGVPLVSLAGRTSVSRAGRSILHAANLPELATDDPESFARVAADLAGDLGRLRDLRLSMRARLVASPLMDHRGFAAKLDGAYRQMWRRWCAAGSEPTEQPHRKPQPIGVFADAPPVHESAPQQQTTGHLFDLAVAHFNAGRLQEADTLYRQVVDRQPNNARALHMVGFVAHRRGLHDVAADWIHRAIAADPHEPEFRNNLGVVAAASGQNQQAIAAYREALALRPDYPEAHCNLGAALQVEGLHDQAVAEYRSALALRGDYAEAHNNLGAALQAGGHLVEAAAAFQNALALKPDYTAARVGLGNLWIAAGEHDKGIAAYRAALAVQPDFAEARFALATALLAGGKLDEGWAEYESRWQANRVLIPDAFARRRWNGDELGGRRILLQTEQGLGDTLQFIRYVPLVAARGGRVLVQCQPQLLRLIGNQRHIEHAFTGSKELPSFDAYCPLLSLPRVFNTKLQTIPAEIPYLSADSTLLKAWQGRLAGEPAALRVGIVWAGDPGHRHDRNRSLALGELAPLARIDGVRFYSLQKGEAARQAQAPPVEMRLTDWTGDLNDFADTAALIVGLDLIVSVDTAVAHLAGALGKTTWVLLPFAADWRWLLARQDSPWYPTMRLFRQSRPGAWDGPVNQAAAALGELVSRDARAGANSHS